MSIRRLLGILVASFALLSAAAGSWQLLDSRQKMLAASWVTEINQLADHSHQLSALLAMERGITAAIIADPLRANPSMHTEMQKIRALVDQQQLRWESQLQRVAARSSAHPLQGMLEGLRDSHQRHLRLRARADLLAAGSTAELDEYRWIASLTARIEELQNFVVLSMLPLPGNAYAVLPVPLLKDLLFSLSEHLGRERAIIGAAIARQQPLSERELEQLGRARIVVERSRGRFLALVERLPATPELQAALSDMRSQLLGDYETLRETVYTSSRHAMGYPVDAEQWYRQASAGIDSVLQLSSLISAGNASDIARLRTSAVRTWWLLALIVVGLTLLFGYTVLAVQQRVLRPLGVLERSARLIGKGDLSQPLPRSRNDEIGSLLQTFEQMRRQLLQDIARREADAERLRKLNALIDNSATAMVVTDTDGTIEYVNQRFEQQTGYSAAECIGRKAGFWGSGLTALELYQSMWQTALSGRVWEGEVINRRRSGEMYWCSVSISPVSNDAGRISHLIGAHVDISERKQIQRQLDLLRNYDELTHLPNRRLLGERFAEMAADQLRKGGVCAVLAIGISRFKQVNDSLGREAGDQLLQRLALRLRQVAGKDDSVARLGGGEFHMLIRGLDCPAQLFERLPQLLEQINRPLQIQGQEIKPVLRAGCCLLPNDGRELEQLLRKASTALHDAERRGIDHVLYDESLGRDAEARLRLENALRSALDHNQLELHYQPKVELESGRIIGVEALARWRDPLTGEPVSPEHFISVAEESGLILQLGAWALREACRQNREWQLAGLPPVVVAVNLSALQLQQGELPALVHRVLAETALPASLLELELTESALMEYPEQANRTLRELKALGLKLSVDDFGTGYSSLSYLSRFPVDLLKIDRGFVSSLEAEPSAAAISTSIIAMAHQLGLQVIAEGVESEAQLQFLERNGCDQIQGYYFSRPLPGAELTKLLAADRRLSLPASHHQQRTLLVVDDEPLIHLSIAEVLSDSGYQLLGCRSAREALELLACNDVQVVLVDDHMPEMSGTELLARIKTQYPDTVRLMFSGYFDARRLRDAINVGSIFKYISKPWDDTHLRRCVDDAFAHHASLQRRLLDSRPGERLGRGD